MFEKNVADPLLSYLKNIICLPPPLAPAYTHLIHLLWSQFCPPQKWNFESNSGLTTKCNQTFEFSDLKSKPFWWVLYLCFWRFQCCPFWCWNLNIGTCIRIGWKIYWNFRIQQPEFYFFSEIGDTKFWKLTDQFAILKLRKWNKISIPLPLITTYEF